MAGLFFKTVERYPSSKDIEVYDAKLHVTLSGLLTNIAQEAIKSVLSREHFKKKHILSGALKSCKGFLSTFRTEERRKVSQF